MSQSPLPPTASANTVNVDNIQGDIIVGLPKKKEEFMFFNIIDQAKFKAAMPSLQVTSTGDVIRSRDAIAEAKKANPGTLIPLALLNIAFSQKGLDALGIKDDLGDRVFSAGQLADAGNLRDEGTTIDNTFDPKWEQAFKTRIDGVLIVAGESWVSVNKKVDDTLKTFGTSIRVIYNLKGSVRPGDQKGHEHFGWEDGISNPAVEGVVKPLPGQRVVRPGIIVTGKEGDTVERPAWGTDGSFLAFRQLNQLVPEFHDFLDKNPIIFPGLDRKQGSELLGARLVGRWKSGAPIQLSPLKDDPELAKDPQRNNNFVYPQEPGEEGQTACPYAAHIRKTNPRNDLDAFSGAVERASMTRAGIPFGPEVTFEEEKEKITEHERGLAFVSYQSELEEGFQFVQMQWANSVDFPPNKDLSAGFDPIIGQDKGASRGTLGTTSGPGLTLPRDFVVSRGGEYFFSPSIHALKTVFAGLPA
ncbi:Dyp-type peroxidase family [Ceratobasidium sp. AG-Ba]|nr:Dyp-type peroxidase family [Ceratobasidium sp. AG-Ba]